jgi:hypothetical protein
MIDTTCKNHAEAARGNKLYLMPAHSSPLFRRIPPCHPHILKLGSAVLRL